MLEYTKAAEWSGSCYTATMMMVKVLSSFYCLTTMERKRTKSYYRGVLLHVHMLRNGFLGALAGLDSSCHEVWLL